MKYIEDLLLLLNVISQINLIEKLSFLECYDLSGSWNSSSGDIVVLKQSQCTGSSSKGWDYLMDRSIITRGDQISGFITDLKALNSWKILWSDDITYITGNFNIVFCQSDYLLYQLIKKKNF